MRILAGAFRGRRLLGPPRGSSTRPITARVMKSLLAMLGSRPAGAKVADLYCGTGTMGLEALSHGAAFCWFAERDRAVLSRLRRNIETVGARDRCRIWAGDIEAHLRGRLARLTERIDLAFVDPPYATASAWDWPAATERIFRPLAGRLAEDAAVILRLPGGLDVPEALGPLAIQRQKRYGDMRVVLMAVRPEDRETGRP